MTDDLIKRLPDLLAKATPGPWTVMKPTNWIMDSRGMDLAHIRGWGFLTGLGHAHGGMDHKLAGQQMDANAALIALVPDLAATVIKQADRIAALEAEVAALPPTPVDASPAADPVADAARVACAIWRHEAERAAPNVARMRTMAAFREELPATQERFMGLARAALAGLKGADHD
jgi:hypothetical protein